MRLITFSLIILSISDCLPQSTAGSVELFLNLENSCRADKVAVYDSKIYGFSGTERAKSMVQRILNVYSLPNTYEVLAGNVGNAAAHFYDGKRYILYSEAYMQTLTASGTDWKALFVFAHELYHHFEGTVFTDLPSRPTLELDADKWAGGALRKLGADLPQTQAWVNTVASDGDLVHPPRNARLEAATIGWVEAGLGGGEPRVIKFGAENTAVYAGSRQGQQWWDWTVFITGDDYSIDQIRCVEYTLHPTFRNPIQKVCDRGSNSSMNFPLESNGWGTFTITIKITLLDGSVRNMKHDLVF